MQALGRFLLVRNDQRNSSDPDVSSIEPLEPLLLEQQVLERSGLIKARPPVPPAISGDDFYHAIPFQILSWAPRIKLYPSFVDKARCDHIIALAVRKMVPSGLAYAPGSKEESQQQIRTSSGTYLSAPMDPDGVLAWVEERIAAVSLLPRENGHRHGEAFNVLKYEHMQHYDSHMDSFDPKTFGPQPSQRIATVLVYLTDVDEGGETVFKKEGLDGERVEGEMSAVNHISGADRAIKDWRSCDDGSFKYKPRQGDALLFWGVEPDGKIDLRSLNGGCPVKNGTKWVMTKWIRSKASGRPEWATQGTKRWS